MENVQLKYVKLHPEAKKPLLSSEHAVGLDVFLCFPGSSVTIPAGDRRILSTKIALIIPEDYWVKVEARSGLAARDGITILCGVIDPDYRGELKIVAHNNDPVDDKVLLHGDRIAQLVLHRRYVASTEEISQDEFDEYGTMRGTGGFGSTG